MGTKRILIADGSPDSRAIYRIILEHDGYEVAEAADGAAALSLLAAGGIDGVVTELTLDGVDGHALLEHVRGNERTRELCVIVLTARALQEDRDRAERAGCTLFLVKPLEPQLLLREVKVLVT